MCVDSLTPRQQNILKELSKKDLSRLDIEDVLEKTYKVSKPTVFRDLTTLLDLGFISQEGAGPSTYYKLAKLPHDLPVIDLDEYFKTDSDDRVVLNDTFDSSLISKIDVLFSKNELSEFDSSRSSFLDRIKNKNDTEIKKELERLIIELSWKSSKIEGNTYSLLDTENLLKNNIEAPHHTRDEKNMILNHRYAFDYILNNLAEFKEFSVKEMISLHDILTRNLNVSKGLREKSVGITGTKYKPLDNKYQIEDAIHSLDKKLSTLESPVLKSFATLVFISYIQPFADGNKRTARLMSNGILLANRYYPLSYRSVDEVEYKKSLIVFYEQHNIYYFKKIFKEQYEFSVKNYFL